MNTADDLRALIRAWSLINEAYTWGHCNDSEMSDEQILVAIEKALHEMGAPGNDTDLALSELHNHGSLIPDEGTVVDAFIAANISDYHGVTYTYPGEVQNKVVLIFPEYPNLERFGDGTIYVEHEYLTGDDDFILDVFDRCCDTLFH